MRASQQQAAYVRAQLDALKIQLQPHFLFSTLHAVGSLMHYDVNTAERMLNRLSELLRMSPQETGNDTISLRRELDFIEAYVEIEKIRFEHRLTVTWSVPHALHDAAIPPRRSRGVGAGRRGRRRLQRRRAGLPRDRAPGARPGAAIPHHPVRSVRQGSA